MSKRPRRADLLNASLQRPTITVIRSPPLTSRSGAASSTLAQTNGTNNDPNMTQQMEALEAKVKKVVDENAELKATVEELKAEITQLKESQEQGTQKTNELEIILKSRRNKIQTDAVFKSTPEMTAAEIHVRFSSEIATFALKDFINFDMEDKPLDEVAKLIAIKMFEQLIPEGCTLANFSTSSMPRFGYITVPSNLFDELAEKLVRFTQGEDDHNLKHALLLRINFGLNDRIKRARKNLRNVEHTPEA